MAKDENERGRDGDAAPAPGDADPLAEDTGGDRRTRVFDIAGPRVDEGATRVRGTNEAGGRVSESMRERDREE